MKLFYVTHSVLTTHRFALIAENEEDLKVELAKREAELRAAPFVVKHDREKNGAIKSFELSADWTGKPAGPPWTGTL